jgi:hypothetical protein
LRRFPMRSSECVFPFRLTKEMTRRRLALPQFIVHFHQAVLENNLAEITVAYDSGWNRLTEKFYAKTEWPEAEVIAPLVNDGSFRAHPSSRRCVLSFIDTLQTNCSSSFIASYTTDMCTLVCNPTSTTASTHMRIAASSSTIY